MTLPIQRSFAGGIVSPELSARTDMVKYSTGLRQCENFTIQKHGGVRNRAGFQFIQEVKYSAKTTVLLKFVASADATYLIEAGDLYFRLFSDGAPLLATTAVSFVAGSSYPSGTIVNNGGSYFWRTLVNPGATTVDTTGAEWYAFANGAQIEIPTPYVDFNLRGLRTAQNLETLTVVHAGYMPHELIRVGPSQWMFGPVNIRPVVNAPTSVTVSGGTPTSGGGNVWAVTANNSKTGEESLQFISASTAIFGTPTIPVVVTFSLVPGADLYHVYREVHGVYGYIGRSSGQPYSDIGQTADLTTRPPVERTTFTSGGDFPSAVAYYQGRRYFASTPNNPAIVYGSRVGLPSNFTVSAPVLDGDALTFTLASAQAQRIRALVSVGRLVILTSSGEWVVQGDQSGAITPSRINAQQTSYVGAAPINHSVVDRQIVYAQYHGSVIHGLSLENNTQSDDKTLYAPHIFAGRRVLNTAFAQVPDSTMWALSSNGNLLGLTILPGQDLSGWHQHTTDGLFDDIVVLPTGGYIGFGGVEGDVSPPHVSPPPTPPPPPAPSTAAFSVSVTVANAGVTVVSERLGAVTAAGPGLLTLEGKAPSGQAYGIRLTGFPAGMGCVVTNGVGEVASINVTSPSVVCSPLVATNWAVSPSPTTGLYMHALVAAGATIVAVGVLNGTTPTSMRSIDNGLSWSTSTIPGAGVPLAVAWNGARVVAVGYGQVRYSDDIGITWTATPEVPLPAGFAYQAIAHNGTVFVAVGVGAAGMRSASGIGWTAITLPVAAQWSRLVWNGVRFVATGAGVSGVVIATSPDGLTWTLQTSPVGATRFRNVALVGATYVAVGTRYAVGTAGFETSGVWTSVDNGVTWIVPAPALLPAMLTDVLMSGQGKLITLSKTTSIFDLYVSDTSAVTWTAQQSTLTALAWVAGIYNGTRFVALGLSSAGVVIATSLTGG